MTKSRISVVVDISDRQKLKAILALRGSSITEWLVEKIKEELAKSDNQKHN